MNKRKKHKLFITYYGYIWLFSPNLMIIERGSERWLDHGDMTRISGLVYSQVWFEKWSLVGAIQLIEAWLEGSISFPPPFSASRLLYHKQASCTMTSAAPLCLWSQSTIDWNIYKLQTKTNLSFFQYCDYQALYLSNVRVTKTDFGTIQAWSLLKHNLIIWFRSLWK